MPVRGMGALIRKTGANDPSNTEARSRAQTVSSNISRVKRAIRAAPRGSEERQDLRRFRAMARSSAGLKVQNRRLRRGIARGRF